MVFALLLIPMVVLSSPLLFFEKSSYERFLEVAEDARVVYLGEIHDRKDIHQFQLRVLRDLHSKGYKLIILMEAFQQQFQDVIDEYLECEIGEEDLLEGTEYHRRWRFGKELYAPMWRFAKKENIKLLALNIPSELLKEVRDRGVDSVVSRYLPRRIMRIHKEHRKFLEEAMGKHEGVVIDRFMAVQLAWDSGMAYRIAKTALFNPEAKLIVIVGSGHVWRGFGIPERVNFLLGELPQLVAYTEEDGIHFLFSKDFSRDSSSTNSSSEPN